MKKFNFSVNALYTEAYDFYCSLKNFKHISTFVLMYIKLSLMVHGHLLNVLSINLVKLHNNPQIS